MEKEKGQVQKLWSTIKDEVTISIKTNELATEFLEKSIIRFDPEMRATVEYLMTHEFFMGTTH